MQEESGTIGSTLAFPADGTENFRNRKHGFGGMGGEGGGGGGDDLGEKLRPGPVVTRTESSDDRLTDFPPV